MSANVIESFFVSLGFEIDTGKLDEFGKKLQSARNTVLAVGTVAAAAAGAIGLFVGKIAEGVDDLGSFANLEDVSVEALQEIGYAAKLNGSSIDALKSSISSVNKTVGEAALGIGRGAKTFEMLGMSAKNADGSIKSFDQVLDEVADRMEGLSRQEQIALTEKLGIDRSLIPLLAKGRGEMEALRKEAQAFGVASDEDARKAGNFMASLNRTRFMLGAIGKTIAVEFMPRMTAMLDGFRDWMTANREIIKSGIGTALKVATALIGTMWDWVVRLSGGLAGLIRWLTTTNAGLFVTAAALALVTKFAAYRAFEVVASGIRLVASALTLANAAALGMSLVIGGIIIALGLLIDDYVNWKEGNDSVIGDLVKEFPLLLDIIQTIEQAVGALVDFWMEQWRILKEPLSDLWAAIWTLVSTLAGALWPVVKMIFTGWAYIMAAVIPIVANIARWFAVVLVGAIAILIGAVARIADAFTVAFDVVKDVVGTVIDAIVAYFTWWWQTVSAIYESIGGLIGKVADALMGGVKGAIEWVMGVIDAAKQKVMGFIDKVTGAIGKVGKLLGLTSKTGDVKVNVAGKAEKTAGQEASPVAEAVAQAPAMQTNGQPPATSRLGASPLAAPGGVIGTAGSNTVRNSTVTQTTTIGAPQITIINPDPAAAAKEARRELEQMNRQVIRNGQSAVDL